MDNYNRWQDSSRLVARNASMAPLFKCSRDGLGMNLFERELWVHSESCGLRELFYGVQASLVPDHQMQTRPVRDANPIIRHFTQMSSDSKKA